MPKKPIRSHSRGGGSRSENDRNVDSAVPDYVIPWLVEDPDAVFGACRAEAR